MHCASFLTENVQYVINIVFQQLSNITFMSHIRRLRLNVNYNTGLFEMIVGVLTTCHT